MLILRRVPSQVLHTRDPGALGDTAENGLLLGRPAGEALWPASGAQGRRGGSRRSAFTREGHGGTRVAEGDVRGPRRARAWAAATYLLSVA